MRMFSFHGRNDAWFKMGLDHIGDFGCIHVRVFAHPISEWRDQFFRVSSREWYGRAGLVYMPLSGLYPQHHDFAPFSGQHGFRFDLSYFPVRAF
jgi:hypothetical protein